jgi:oxygen-independent coproporphyrinogen III oxidase
VNPDPQALYVHIPFCDHICAYCDFTKLFYRPDWGFSYVAELEREIDSCGDGPYKTIYLGGGTPTSLDLDLFACVLSELAPRLSNGGEFTCEANPESLSEAKLALMRLYGVNRLSIGIESSSPRLLKLMGRNHDFADSALAVERARKAGFDNISGDFIYALPHEGMATLQKDIARLLSLKLEHLSAYCLSVNPGTRFAAEGYREMEEGKQADQYEAILASFRAAGYDRYEVSSFCRPGRKSRHNLVYWTDEEYYGTGLGASGYVRGIRYDNTKNLKAYLEHRWRCHEETVTPQDELKYYFTTNLRLEEGFALSSFRRRFGFDFFSVYREKAEKLAQEGLLTLLPSRVKATDRGILLLDRILLALY